MAEELTKTIDKYINDKLVLAVASNPVRPAEASRLKIRPVKLKGRVMFQVAKLVGKQEFHENLDAGDVVKLLEESAGSSFRQIELKNDTSSAVIMISKKGTVTVKEHRLKEASAKPCSIGTNNRKKEYVLEEGKPVDFLVELGVMTPAGKVVAQRYDKFRQINRYLEFVEDIVPTLSRDREISIIDFGCGKSYLTFALYYYLHELKGYAVKITGLDLKEDVIENCNRLSEKLGYKGLSFLHGDIADYSGTDSVDMVVTLHACDTATDYALFKAISWNARVIFCVPCCQHEINRQIKNYELNELLKYGLIKERMSALITDSLRACMLEEQGYKTQILEFIDMEHTPKNILIRAVKKTGAKSMTDTLAKKEAQLKGMPYRQLIEELAIEPTLYRLLNR